MSSRRKIVAYMRGRIIDLVTNCCGYHALQNALACKEVCLLIVSELLWGDPATTLVNEHASYVWHKPHPPTVPSAWCPRQSLTTSSRAPRFRRQCLRLIMRLGSAQLSLRRLLAAKSDHKAVLSFVRDTDRFPRYAV
ncbi:hypothetical protein B0H14DRAFT_3526211 [Mycena olivaceomarginata]|nr:hypothetical protein B0H14DRAFT_3526211 [Mycena olivaceomarginata]